MKIIHLTSKRLIGMHMTMSLADDKTGELWRSLMPRRREIKERVDNAFLSMQVYPKDEENHFLPTIQFEKWAVVEVSETAPIPDGMEAYTLQGGLYGVFEHHGPANLFPKTMHFIFGEWLPNSEYELDDREQFEVLGEEYDPIDPDAREEIWIPLKKK